MQRTRRQITGGGRGPRYVRLVVSTPGGSVPVNSVAPVISFAGSNNSVGVLATSTTGSWTNSPTAYTYDWRTTAGGSLGAADAGTYTPIAAVAGQELFCRVTAENGAGLSLPEDSNGIIVRPYNSAVPTISGTNTVGSTLTGAQGTWAGEDSLANMWVVGGVDSGDTDTSYTVASGDAGETIVFEVTGTNAGGDTVAVSTTMTIRPYNSAVPTISGTNTVGSTLTGAQGTWAGEGSLANMWIVDSVDSGDTDTSYTIGAGDAGHEIVFEVTGTNAGGDTVGVSTAMTVRPYNSAVPTISGTNTVGSTLTGAQGTWAGEDSLANMWVVGGVDSGDTDTSYTVTSGDAGETIVFEVTGTNAGGDTVVVSTTMTIRPYNSAVPTISGTNTVGSTLTGAQGTWAGEDSLANMWVVAGVDSGDTDTSYTVASGDAGETIVFEVTGTNAGGDTVAVSTTMTIRPYLTTAPVIDDPAGNSVGNVLEVTTAPVWAGADTEFSEWALDGVGTGVEDLTYTIQVADAGAVVTFQTEADNAGGTTGPTASNSITVRPYWSVAPNLNVIENWPGGTVTVTAGTVAGETSGPTGEWELDLVGTSDTDTSYAVQTADVGEELTYLASASNAGGASTSRSDGVTIVQVEGVHRANEADDYLTRAAEQPADDGTLVVEFIVDSASSGGALISWGRQPGANNTRREVSLFVTSTGAFQGLLRNGTNLGIMSISGAVTINGVTRYIGVLDWDVSGSAAQLSVGVPGGTPTQLTTVGGAGFQDFRNSATDAVPTLFRRAAALVAGGVAVSQLAGVLNAVCLTRRMSGTEITDLFTAGSIRDAGLFTDGSLGWYLRPANVSQGTALTNASTQLASSGWTIQGGTSDCTLGDLNEAL